MTILHIILFMYVYRPDTRHIFVDVGLGFHVQFTWSEALSYISVREEKLARLVPLIYHLYVLMNI